MKTFTACLQDLKPSQLYISQQKLQRNQAWLTGTDINYEPLPVRMLGGEMVLTDGHTRAVILCLLGVTEAKVYWDEDDLDWEAYDICVSWCKYENTGSPYDLTSRVISAEDYDHLWLGRCQAMQEDLEKARRASD